MRALRADEPVLAETLGVYLDCFGDVAAAAQHLHVHPNTVRYRIRRVEQLLGTSLNDADVRLLLSLSLRATGLSRDPAPAETGALGGAVRRREWLRE